MNLLFISAVLAQPTFQKVGQVFRLSFEGVQSLGLRQESSASQGGACQGKPTDDLIIHFSELPSWLDQFQPKDIFDVHGPCEVKGRPLDGGTRFELRLSYLQQKGRRLESINYSSQTTTYVDHWFSGGKPASDLPKVKVSYAKKPELTKNFSEFFENRVSWQQISGDASGSTDVNSPLLDKFRDFPNEKNPGIEEEPIERLPLKLPLIDLPLVSFSIEFEEKKLPLERFTEEDISQAKSITPHRKKLLLDSLNLVLVFVEKKEWARAFEAMRILENGNFKKLLPRDRASWWALRGYIAFKYSEVEFPKKTKDAKGLLTQRALDDWREGIRRFSGLGGINQEYAEYMIVELVRKLFERKLPFAALSSMIWAQQYSWSAVTEERFEYLKALAFENLSLFDEADKAFKAFFAGRSSLSANVIHDRRLVPASALWSGDMALKQKRYRRAIEGYSDALNKIPSPRKFSFEKSWYPDFVKQFPEVLINRAEAYTRVGEYSNALKDLRAFIFVAPNHPSVSVAYYRVGDLLEQLGADREKSQGAWRECVFRFKDQLVGPLCQARLSYFQFINTKESKTEWPRLIADIEDSTRNVDILPKSSFVPDDVKIFSAILLADAFLRTDQPWQALMRLEPLENLKPSSYMSLWYREYRIVSFLGFIQKKLKEGNPKAVVSEYEKRQKTLFLFQTRGEVLLTLSQAFGAMGLWEEARKTFEEAVRVRSVLKRPINRVYDPPEEVWSSQPAIIAAHLFSTGKVSELEAKKSLTQAPEAEEDVIRAWILFYQKKKDPTQETNWWKKLEAKSSLGSKELRDYAKALEITKQSQELKDLLERRVGVLLTQVYKAQEDKNFSSELFVKLAELRRSSKEFEKALTVLNFLLTLPAQALHERTPRTLILYQKGLVLKDLKRLEESLQSFQEAQLSAPDSIWGKLSRSNAVEIESSLKRQSENR